MGAVAGGRLSMEVPVHDIVNTGEETFRAGSGVSGFINVCLTRQSASQPWGFRLQGGKDRGFPFQLLKVPLDSIASHSGAKSGDYLVKIGGHDVFHLNHEEAKELIRQGGNKLLLVVERGEKIVPSLNSAFPKPKEQASPRWGRRRWRASSTTRRWPCTARTSSSGNLRPNQLTITFLETKRLTKNFLIRECHRP